MNQTLFVDDYVLYADDDPDDRMILKESFENCAPEKKLIAVTSGQELLDFLEAELQQKGRPCLIILDQNMPGMGGDETLTIIKRNEWYRDIPVVMFSTSDHLNIPILQTFHVGLEFKPDTYTGWEKIALTLLKHCDRFENENPAN